MKVLRAIYKYWSTLIIVAVIVQIGAAGYGAFYGAEHLKDKGDKMFHSQWDHGWSFHSGLGWLTVYGAGCRGRVRPGRVLRRRALAAVRAPGRGGPHRASADAVGARPPRCRARPPEHQGRLARVREDRRAAGIPVPRQRRGRP